MCVAWCLNIAHVRLFGFLSLQLLKFDVKYKLLLIDLRYILRVVAKYYL
jgi:hypothetical protein